MADINECLSLSQIKKFKVAELRDRLQSLGLNTTGLKPELVNRLFEALNGTKAPGSGEHYEDTGVATGTFTSADRGYIDGQFSAAQYPSANAFVSQFNPNSPYAEPPTQTVTYIQTPPQLQQQSVIQQQIGIQYLQQRNNEYVQQLEENQFYQQAQRSFAALPGQVTYQDASVPVNLVVGPSIEQLQQEQLAQLRQQQQEAEQRRLQEELEQRQLQQEAEQRRLQEQLEERRIQEELEQRRLQQEAEHRRLKEELDQRRLQQEAEERRLQELEQRRLQEELEQRRLQQEEEEEEERILQEELEERRLQEELQQRRLQQEEQMRLQEELEERRVQEELEQRQLQQEAQHKLLQELHQRQMQHELEQRRLHQEEQRRLQEELEQRRLLQEAEERRLQEMEQQRLIEEEAEQKRLQEEELKRLQEEEEERLLQEEEERRLQDEEARRLQQELEERKIQEEIEQRRLQEEIEQKRLQKELEQKRLQEELEQRRLEEEIEQKRLEKEAEERRLQLQQEEEEKRIQEELNARKLQELEEKMLQEELEERKMLEELEKERLQQQQLEEYRLRQLEEELREQEENEKRQSEQLLQELEDQNVQKESEKQNDNEKVIESFKNEVQQLEQVEVKSAPMVNGFGKSNESQEKVKLTKNQKKKLRKRKQKANKLKEKPEKIPEKAPEVEIVEDDRMDLDEENEEDEDEENIEIEYVPEEITKDPAYFQFIKVFDKFRGELNNDYDSKEEEIIDPIKKMLERKKPVELELKDEEEKKDGEQKLSKRKLKQLTRMTVADLKQKVTHPELVEMHDVTAKDPLLLLHLKATRNSVPVPRHWCYKRKYLQGKRGFEKPPFKLPEFIRKTGIMEMRQALAEKEDSKSLKTKMREKIRPKMGKIDIDYQKLHDAFFKWQTKPKCTIHGDLYYEGKEFETRLKEKKPGDLSNELRVALGMPTGPNSHKCPPPWLIAMQRYGPPPSYPNLKIPGLNAPIPEGCSFGYHAGGWGKPPVDEYGRPLYGDVFGITQTNDNLNVEEEIDRTIWGEMESEEEEEVEDEEEEDEATVPGKPVDTSKEPEESGLMTPAEGLVTPSGLTSVPAGMETPDIIELRKKKIESEMDSGENPQLYTVISEKKTDKIGKDIMGSTHVYDISGSTATKKAQGIEMALDPNDLDLDSTEITAKYEQTYKDQQQHLEKEDLSDMVAEHVARQKRKKQQETVKSTKKYKEFKF